MSAKRIKICIRRACYLLLILIGAVNAWNVGPLLLENALHGWQQIPELAVTIGVSWMMVQLTGLLGDRI